MQAGPSLGCPYPISFGHPGDVTPSLFLPPQGSQLCPLLHPSRSLSAFWEAAGASQCPHWRGDGAAQAWGQGAELGLGEMLGLGETLVQGSVVGSSQGWVLGAGCWVLAAGSLPPGSADASRGRVLG